jgi:hypothetical protein
MSMSTILSPGSGTQSSGVPERGDSTSDHEVAGGLVSETIAQLGPVTFSRGKPSLARDAPGHAEWRAAEGVVVSNGVSNQPRISDG